MHQIDRFEIEGFWDTHHVKVQLHKDVTFFIGPNGTGKTTLDDQIGSYFSRANDILARQGGGGVPMDDVGILIGLKRIEGVIDQWRTLQDQLAEIFAQRDRFVSATNALLQRKKMEIAERRGALSWLGSCLPLIKCSSPD